MEHEAGVPEPAAIIGSGDPEVDVRRWHRLREVGFVSAVMAVVFMWLDSRFGWLDYQPGGTAFFTYVRPAFLVLLFIGALLAIRWEIAGGIVGAFAAGATGSFAINQLIGLHAAVVIVLLTVPSAAWVCVDLLSWKVRHAMIGLAAALSAVAVGAGTGELVYELQFGPTHPESDVQALPPSAVRWVWSGGVTGTGASVRARMEDADAGTARLAVTSTSDFADATYFDAADRDGPIASFVATGLEPGVAYQYAVEVGGDLDAVRTGTFTTFPEGPTSFSFTIGACARVGSNGSVFDAIRGEDPLFHLIAGDFHYGDVPDDNRDRYDEVIDVTLRQPAQAALYRTVPIAYVWDDHDYGVNDSSSLSSSRVAAMRAYRANVPSYELASDLSAVYQSFDVGRVRFLLTDARSAREPGETMLGGRQLAWFLDAITAAADEQALVVWLNPVPWIADAQEGADHWGGYDAERRLIADVIAENDIDNLLMVSGDAHMVAIDDGTNTDYSAAGGAGFPLIHAAALDRPGSTKGGPYSHGELGGSGQYAVVEVDDSGDEITVGLRAKRYDGELLLTYDFSVAG